MIMIRFDLFYWSITLNWPLRAGPMKAVDISILPVLAVAVVLSVQQRQFDIFLGLLMRPCVTRRRGKRGSHHQSTIVTAERQWYYSLERFGYELVHHPISSSNFYFLFEDLLVTCALDQCWTHIGVPGQIDTDGVVSLRGNLWESLHRNKCCVMLPLIRSLVPSCYLQ